MKWTKKHIFIIVTVCLVLAGSGFGYYLKKVYQPNSQAVMFLHNTDVYNLIFLYKWTNPSKQYHK